MSIFWNGDKVMAEREAQRRRRGRMRRLLAERGPQQRNRASDVHADLPAHPPEAVRPLAPALA